MKKIIGRIGFTLLELLIVVAIIAVLIALALPFYQDYIEKSKYTATIADLSNLRKAVQMYEQLEQSSISTFDMRPLIGKYLEDFRKNDLTQKTPRDAYGNDFSFNPTYGIIFSYGPDHVADMGLADLKARRATGDDIITTYLPPFYLMRVNTLNLREIEFEFSRKVDDSTITASTIFWLNRGAAGGSANTGPTMGTHDLPGTLFKISSTVYRYRHDNLLTSGMTYRLYVSGIKAQTQRDMSSSDSDERPGLETSSTPGAGSNNGCWLDFSSPAS
ncbi:MAG: prepilin-type N-terminal cleavage/methylation domain-containing protein [Candidatus Riflebacteria bacterium]|nr:prepilin-type N-terminal cleavage/methylation domain-containing protein [Candidatus Riflebacteria bacterium]